jgi:hypothetical protein
MIQIKMKGKSVAAWKAGTHRMGRNDNLLLSPFFSKSPAKKDGIFKYYSA